MQIMETLFTEDQIQIGNLSINKFMGYGIENPTKVELYHKSFDSLKPVIAKILSMEESEFELYRPLQYELDSIQIFLKNMSLQKDIIDFWNEVISAIVWYEGAKVKYETILKLKTETGTTIPRDNWGVHETHCCKRHGCKYGEHDNCPVTLGLIKQAYGCETGSDFSEDCFGEDINPERVFELYEEETDSPTYEGFKNWFLNQNFIIDSENV